MMRAGAALFGILVALAPASAAAQDGALLDRGMTVYQDQKCQVCHAIAGKGNAKGPLDDVGSRLTADELRAWIVDATGMTAKTKAPRKPVMRNYSTLPKADIEALVAYMANLKKN